jgi:hypothetical protein
MSASAVYSPYIPFLITFTIALAEHLFSAISFPSKHPSSRKTNLIALPNQFASSSFLRTLGLPKHREIPKIAEDNFDDALRRASSASRTGWTSSSK